VHADDCIAALPETIAEANGVLDMIDVVSKMTATSLLRSVFSYTKNAVRPPSTLAHDVPAVPSFFLARPPLHACALIHRQSDEGGTVVTLRFTRVSPHRMGGLARSWSQLQRQTD
jgi:hypothetical protein